VFCLLFVLKSHAFLRDFFVLMVAVGELRKCWSLSPAGMERIYSAPEKEKIDSMPAWRGFRAIIRPRVDTRGYQHFTPFGVSPTFKQVLLELCIFILFNSLTQI
jgi:hypothetical protein